MEMRKTILAPTFVRINVNALKRNLAYLREQAKGASIIAVVKANAYGHGAIPITKALVEEGVKWFAVATLPEGIALREAGIKERILVMGAPLPHFLTYFKNYKLDLLVSSPEIATAAIEYSDRYGVLNVHPKLDTGMGRVGMHLEEFQTVLPTLLKAKHVNVSGLWTHFAVADEVGHPFTLKQWNVFYEAAKPYLDKVPLIHVTNSGGLLQSIGIGTLKEKFAVRTGIALYGYSPLNEPTERPILKPVMQFCSTITQIKTVKKGETISYGQLWTASKPSRIATINAGYADGFPRGLTNIGQVGIQGKLFPVVGRVCMDMFMVDISEEEQIHTGDEVVLWGEGGMTLYDVAHQLNTIPYELTCGITQRVERIYIES